MGLQKSNGDLQKYRRLGFTFTFHFNVIKQLGHKTEYVCLPEPDRLVKHLIDTDEAWHNGFSVFYPLVICARKNWIEIKTDSFQQTLSFWKHKNMVRSIRWSVWRWFLSEENGWNLCDCLRFINNQPMGCNCSTYFKNKFLVPFFGSTF